MKKVKWYSPENWEKYTLILMSLAGFFFIGYLLYDAYFSSNSLVDLILKMFFVLTVIVITGMLIRKGMKYRITRDGLEIGYDAKTVTESEVKTNDDASATINNL